MNIVEADKIGSATSPLNLTKTVSMIDEYDAPRPGDVVVVKALSESVTYGNLELPNGRLAKINRNDVLLGVLGKRRALKGFVGDVPDTIKTGDKLHLLNMGGVIGICKGHHSSLSNAIEVEVLGIAVDDSRFQIPDSKFDGNQRRKILNIADNALQPTDFLNESAPIVVIAGTCMNSGKTVAATEIIKQAAHAGLKVAGAKMSGVAALRDTLNMEDHGASWTASFLDCGLPSTVDCENLAPVAKAILNHLNSFAPDLIVVELGDGIVGGYAVDSVLRDFEIKNAISSFVFCASDYVGVIGGITVLKNLGIEIDVIAGSVTDSQMGEDFVQNEYGLNAGNARRDGLRLFELVNFVGAIHCSRPIPRGRPSGRGQAVALTIMKIKITIFGGSGYGGSELLRILLFHPNAEIVKVTANEHAGKSVGEVHKNLFGLTDLKFEKSPEDLSKLENIDVAFFALPHGQALNLIPNLPENVKVVDLSGDFRINDAEIFKKFYKLEHNALDLQKKFVYGLTETNREQIKTAKYVANPGCFATATLLALVPMVKSGLLTGKIIVDAKTGSSGSGAKAAANTHHPQRMNSFYAYKPFQHQHVPEIEQHLKEVGEFENDLIFMTHSLPVSRGIFASCYLETTNLLTNEDVKNIYELFYKDSFFVRIVEGSPDINWVKTTNFCDIAAHSNGKQIAVFSAIDNLVKGAAGQAVQNMNLMFGLDETTGLKLIGTNP